MEQIQHKHWTKQTTRALIADDGDDGSTINQSINQSNMMTSVSSTNMECASKFSTITANVPIVNKAQI
jgi:hypothetical protein